MCTYLLNLGPLIILLGIQVDWISRVVTFFRIQVDWLVQINDLSIYIDWIILRGTESPCTLASPPHLGCFSTTTDAMPQLISYGALTGFVRPFAVGACSAECAWYMATFSKHRSTLSTAATCTRYSQPGSSRLYEQGIDVRGPMHQYLTCRYPAADKFHVLPWKGLKQTASLVRVYKGAEKINPAGRQDRVMANREVLVQTAEPPFKGNSRGSRTLVAIMYKNNALVHR